MEGLTCLCSLRLPLQNQAEAHYKGHKHARKLKAMEAQKNRQRRAVEASSMGRERERERERSKAGAGECLPLPSLMDTSLMEGTSELRDEDWSTAVTRALLSPITLSISRVLIFSSHF